MDFNYSNAFSRRFVGGGVSVISNMVCNPNASEMESTNRKIPFIVVKNVEDFIRARHYKGRLFVDTVRAFLYKNYGYRWYREQDFYVNGDGVCTVHID